MADTLSGGITRMWYWSCDLWWISCWVLEMVQDRGIVTVQC